MTEIDRPHHPDLLEYAILLLARPEVQRHHAGWRRVGNLGVVAESNGEVLGAALCRLFTEEDHGEGYVDPCTPELGIAANKEHRGRGIGGRLLAALEARARQAGYGQLSLSVDRENPSARLYRRAGYEVLSEDEDGYLMLKRLGCSLL